MPLTRDLCGRRKMGETLHMMREHADEAFANRGAVLIGDNKQRTLARTFRTILLLT